MSGYWRGMRYCGAVVLAAGLWCGVAAGATKNELKNGDFSAATASGAPAGWKWGVRDGHPTCRAVDDAQGPRVVMEVKAEDEARFSQSLSLPAEHYYTFRCEYRITSQGPMLPNVAVRIAAQTKKGLWRIWAYSKPSPSKDWRPLELEFLVPSDITERHVGLTYFVNPNRNAGTIELRNVEVAEKPLTDYQRKHAYKASDGSVYFPQQAEPTPSDPALPKAVAAQPLFWWTGADADGVGPQEVPDVKRINRPVVLPLAGGGDASTVLVLQALKPLKGLSVHLSGVPSSMVATLKRVDVWRQRVGFRSGFYTETPERLLDLPSSMELAAGQRLQLFLRVKTGTSAKPGRHSLAITVEREGRAIFQTPVEVRVQPIVLAADASQPVWGLYPDPGRWKNFTPEAMDRELKWLHECGIRTLLLYMPLDRIAADKPLSDDNLTAARAHWRTALNEWGDRYMDHFIKTGFGPVWVCNVQSLPRTLARVAGLKAMGEEDRGEYNPRLLRYIRAYLEVIEQVRRQRNWPEFYYHLVDEPGSGTNVTAVAEYSVLRDLNLKGYTTANQATVVRDFRDSVDLFAISNGVFANPAELARLQGWLAGYPNAQLWWYGAAGTYSGQDGRINKNRFGMGFFTWLVGAKGAFLWTYQRVSGSPFDDFDGSHMDACLTYPPEDPAQRYSGEAVSTLQWEGVRDGMTDYRYLQLLDQRLAAHRGQEAALKIEAEVEALRKEIWKHPTGGVSNRTLDGWRAKVAGWIVALGS